MARSMQTPFHYWRIAPKTAIALGMACWIGFAVVAWLIASDRIGFIDRAGLMVWRGADGAPVEPHWLTGAVRDFTSLGGVTLRNLFALAAVAALLFLKLRREAMSLAITILSGWLVSDMLKRLIERPRPQIVPHLTDAAGTSFPSAHSFNSALVYLTIALAFAAFSRRRSMRVTLIACAMIVSLAVAWTRVWLGVHWPSDVVAGWLGGAGWALLASALFGRPAKAMFYMNPGCSHEDTKMACPG
jgi:undecaprenyl-diphosphatase